MSLTQIRQRTKPRPGLSFTATNTKTLTPKTKNILL